MCPSHEDEKPDFGETRSEPSSDEECQQNDVGLQQVGKCVFPFCSFMKIVRTVGTGRKPPLQGSSFKSAMKQVSRDVEALESDPEDVTDEMMETAYVRYWSPDCLI